MARELDLFIQEDVWRARECYVDAGEVGVGLYSRAMEGDKIGRGNDLAGAPVLKLEELEVCWCRGASQGSRELHWHA